MSTDFDLRPNLDDDAGDDGFDSVIANNDGQGSPLDALRTAVANEVVHETPTWKIPRRKGVAVTYTTKGLDPERYQRISQQCTIKTGEFKGQVRWDKVHAMVLAGQCTGILVNGVEVNVDGKPVTFASRAAIQMAGDIAGTKVSTAADVVRVFYGGPKREYGMAMSDHCGALLDMAGVGTENAEEPDEDPT